MVYTGGIYEKNTATGEVTKYYFAGGQRIAMRKGASVYYLANDHLSGTAVTMDAAGNQVSRTRYYPFGQGWTQEGSTPTDKLFTGHQRESNPGGTYYAGARFYSADIGRFVSADTMVPNASNPQELNRYSYVTNNPLKYNDPTGHMAGAGGFGGMEGFWGGNSILPSFPGFAYLSEQDWAMLAYNWGQWYWNSACFSDALVTPTGGPMCQLVGWQGGGPNWLNIGEWCPCLVGDLISGSRFIASCLNWPCDWVSSLGAAPGPPFWKIGKVANVGWLSRSGRMVSKTEIDSFLTQIQKAGINYPAPHELYRKLGPGVTAHDVIDTYRTGALYFQKEERRWIRYKYGLRVVTDQATGGNIITFYEAKRPPTGRWNPVPWRPGQ